jgi:hypothetical protein
VSTQYWKSRRELVEQEQSHGATKVGWQRGKARLEEEWDRGELACGMGEHEEEEGYLHESAARALCGQI